MNQISKIIVGSICCSSMLMATHAHAFLVEGTKQVTIPVARPHLHTAVGTSSGKKMVGLMKIKLSTEEIAVLQKEAKKPVSLASSTKVVPSLSKRSMLNLEQFPVLDQGQHGSCVTFAISAAINFVLGKPDHVSELCSLTLGSTLAANGYHLSGWNGSSGPYVLEQFERFGYVTIDDQRLHGCGDDIKNYPLIGRVDENDQDTMEVHQLSLSDHFKMSKRFHHATKWQSLLTEDQRFGRDALHPYDGDQLILQVKKLLSSASKKNSRVGITIGFMLYDLCSVGACAKTVVARDTWAVTSAIANELKFGFPQEGHEVMVIGFDDDAVAVDDDGVTHQGLFKLRNSWSSEVGDQGDYYMTYEYFKKLVDEVQRVYK